MLLLLDTLIDASCCSALSLSVLSRSNASSNFRMRSSAFSVMLLVCELMLMLDDQLFVEHADLAVSVAVDLCDLAVTCGDDEPDPDLREFCDRCVRCDLFERCVLLPLAFAFMCLFACSICALSNAFKRTSVNFK